MMNRTKGFPGPYAPPLPQAAAQGPGLNSAPAMFSNNGQYPQSQASPNFQGGGQYIPPPPAATYAQSFPPPPGISYGMPQAAYGAPYAQYQPQQPMQVVKQPKPSMAKMFKHFALNQQVEVCLRGNMWVLGIVVGALKLWDKLTGGVGYDVRYTLSGESRTDTFPADSLRNPHHQY
ncbi:hypothetical protein C8J56DRAFT_488870 [Mycena floridula]|nr:hypothetical protein C8J56DRAFT_488870 [Mycena floridula]